MPNTKRGAQGQVPEVTERHDTGLGNTEVNRLSTMLGAQCFRNDVVSGKAEGGAAAGTGTERDRATPKDARRTREQL